MHPERKDANIHASTGRLDATKSLEESSMMNLQTSIVGESYRADSMGDTVHELGFDRKEEK